MVRTCQEKGRRARVKKNGRYTSPRKGTERKTEHDKVEERYSKHSGDHRLWEMPEKKRSILLDEMMVHHCLAFKHPQAKLSFS